MSIQEKRTYERACVKQVFDKEVVRKDGTKETIKDTRFVVDIGGYVSEIATFYKVDIKDFYQLDGRETFEKILSLGKIKFTSKATTKSIVSKEKIMENIKKNKDQFSKEEREQLIKELQLGL